MYIKLAPIGGLSVYRLFGIPDDPRNLAPRRSALCYSSSFA
jgi:hypothetical protein